MQLVASVLAQAPRADQRLVRYLAPTIRAVARRFRLSAARHNLAPDDLENGVFEKIWAGNLRVLRQWDQQNPLGPYIATVAKNYCIECVRRKVHDLVDIDGGVGTNLTYEEMYRHIDEPPSPEEELNIQETQALMRFCIEELSAGNARMIRLRHLEGLGHKEIAHRLGCPIGSVGTTLLRAEEKLKRIIESEFPGLLPEIGIGG